MAVYGQVDGDVVRRISRAITEIHPYEVPEIIATPLVDVTAAYAAWLDEQCD